MGLSDIHTILFNAYVMFSVILGVWSAVSAGRNQPLSGNFWGAVATISLLAAGILVVGVVMLLSGQRPADGRVWLYILYMIFLVVIMPGLFTLLRGRDDRGAALAFSLLAFFNAGVAVSMADRVLTTWIAA